MNNLNQLRQQLLEKRLAIHHKELLDQNLAKQLSCLLDSMKVHSIGIYWPIHDEFDPRSVATEWQQKNPSNLLGMPYTTKNQPLSFVRWTPQSKMVLGLFNIPIPIHHEPQDMFYPELLLVPCLGWSKQNGKCWRLGYGGGFYDRTLEDYALRGQPIKTIGLAYQALEVLDNQWQPEKHDRPLDQLVLA